MNTQRKIRFYLLVPLLMLAGIVLLFFGVSWVAEYRPAERETVYRSDCPGVLPDTLKVITWNIGYAGLGAGMDFFYDGGTRVRDTREHTEANLERIIGVLREADADIMLLQEVDMRSKRTYLIDEVERLRQAFPDYTLTFAYNYNAWWVPIPLTRPMGRVKSGLVMLSRVRPLEAVRWQYPSAFPFPVRLFNLKRCLLSVRFLTSRGDTLMVSNTHNTAYDTGGMRTQEMGFLRELLARADSAGTATLTGGDWNQYPPGYVPRAQELSNPYFRPEGIDGVPFAPFARFVYDTLSPSLRYLDRPYGPQSLTTLTDFFLVSDSLCVLGVETLPEGFTASDHNPVLIRVSTAVR